MMDGGDCSTDPSSCLEYWLMGANKTVLILTNNYFMCILFLVLFGKF